MQAKFEVTGISFTLIQKLTLVKENTKILIT